MGSDENLQTLLKRRTRFRILRHPASCGSTQDIANEGIERGSPPPPDGVFWADHQTRGRGRQQRAWHDEQGLDLAVTFRVTAAFPHPLALPAALPVAVLEAAEPLAGRELRIKWPNDVYADGRKLSGVLIDRDSQRPDTFRIGVGLNVNSTAFPDGLRNPATSLRLLAEREFDRHQVLLALAESVDAMLTAVAARELTGHEQIFGERLGLLGRRVDVLAGEPLQGVLTDIDFERLVLDGRRAVPLGVVSTLRES